MKPIFFQGSSSFASPLHLEVSEVSRHAKEVVEGCGGRVKCDYYDRLGLRRLLSPEKFTILPRFARVPPKLRHKYVHPEEEKNDQTVD